MLGGAAAVPEQLGTPRAELVDGRDTEQRHGPGHLLAEEVEDVGDTRLPGRGQPVEVRAADRAGGGTQRDRLDHVGASADAPIDDELDPTGGRPDDLGKDVEGGGHVVELTTSVVADLDRVDAEVGGPDGVGRVDAPLEDDRACPSRPEVGDIGPVSGLVGPGEQAAPHRR